jgi:hypothetical protein
LFGSESDGFPGIDLREPDEPLGGRLDMATLCTETVVFDRLEQITQVDRSIDLGSLIVCHIVTVVSQR